MNARPRPVKPRRRRSLIADARAATAVEYGLILALVVLAVVSAIVNVADATSGIWNNLNATVTNAR